MNREDIIRMAREAGCYETDTGELVTDEINLTRFAALVAAAERDRIADEAKHIIKRAEARGAAAEREACAKVCEEHPDGLNMMGGAFVTCAAAIRARGQA